MSMAPAQSHASRPPAGERTFDVERIRRDFPILQTEMNGKPLVYLDNAATSQKPQAVLDVLSDYYSSYNANIHRSVYRLGAQATDAYENVRKRVQRFIGCDRPEEIIFVRGATEAINLVAQTFGKTHVGKGDEVVVSTMEHHSNIVPWQILCEQQGATLLEAPINDDGELLIDEFEKLLNPRTRIVAVTHVSNALGTVTPIKQIVDLAHQHGAHVLVDGAQAVPHMKVDVSHKMLGPTGIGVLHGKRELLEEMPPYQGGGDMIKSVTFAKTTYNDLPHKFEAGTPNIAGTIAFGAAIDYLSDIGMDDIAAYEQSLLEYATEALSGVPGLRLIGTARDKASVLSFVMDDVHAHDVGTILDQQGIAVRTGHHCSQPVMDRFGVTATARASLSFYNTTSEIDALASGVRQVAEVFQ